MASKTGKLLAGLAAIGILGAVAYAATGEDDDIGNAGMVLSGDCNTIALEDPAAFTVAWVRFTLEGDGPTHLVDGTTAGMEAYMTAFLGHVFKDCFPPTPGDDFTWVTLVPHEEHWTWDEIVASLMIQVHGGPGLEGATPSGQEIADAGASISESPVDEPFAVIDAAVEWDDDDLPPVPTPDPPTPEGEGAGVEMELWDLTPDNLVKAVTADNMAEGGISRAMEPSNTESPQESAVFLVYDPNFPGWGRMEQDLIVLANQNPDVLFITASTVDTIKHLGLPEHPGLAWAVNAADKEGAFKYPEDAVTAVWEEGPPSDQDWNALIGHALSPLDVSMSFG